MATCLNIGIAGAGLMGRLLAWQLNQLGHQVTVFDKNTRYSGEAAGFTAAGMLTPYAEAEAAELPIYRLGLRSLQLWPAIIKQLKQPVRYQQQGSILVAHPADAAELQQFESQLRHSIQPSPEQQLKLDQGALTALEPELAQHFQTAMYFPEEAWISASDSMQALANEAIENGVAWREQHAVDRAEAHTIVSNGNAERFDWVIDCRGTGAKPQWQDVRAVRGEVLWVQAPEVNIKRLVRLMHPRYRLYLVPTGKDDIYIIGATQIESEDWSAMSVRSALELLSALYSLHSGFAEARIIKMDSNCRPALKDNLPKVECSQGLMRVNGLFRHGYLLAPAICEQVIAHIQEKNQSFNDDVIAPISSET
ncbi:glycine oxidase ThiO [Agaribacterium sp. ZY112]|uniref:glycine oxidase ThiO n=1 Tax=Agaribacterium sp. ZY112 TaxID=3233574 RepID=UPI003525D8C2